jgi:hypothetical protein
LENDQIRNISEHFNRNQSVISQDLKKVELRLRKGKNSKGAMAVLENKLIKDEKRKIELNYLLLDLNFVIAGASLNASNLTEKWEHLKNCASRRGKPR